MRTLTAFGEGFEAERIVKTADSIIGYNGDFEVFAFRGVSDFSLFELDGEYDDPTPELSDEVNTLKRENAELRQAVSELSLVLAAVMGGGE